MPTTNSQPLADASMALVDQALQLSALGVAAAERPDLFAPEFRVDGPARDLFPGPGSERDSGDLTDVAIETRSIEASGNAVRVRVAARGICHRVLPEGQDVRAEAVLFFRIADGRIAAAQGVLQWDDPAPAAA